MPEIDDTYRLPGAGPPIGRMILVPAIITLAVTLLRLVGELLQWSPRFFSREAGGGAAVVGIVWLVPVFAIYFALRLIRMGLGPRRVAAALGWAVLGLVVFFATGALGAALKAGPMGVVAAFAVGSMAALAVAWRGWPALSRTLLAYGLAARVPVALLMLIAILAQWGTHYEKGPPDFPAMSPIATWFWIGLVPQLTLWIGFTVVVGCLFGGLAAAVALRGSRSNAVPDATRA